MAEGAKGLNILLVEVIYLHTEEVAGWSKYEMVLLVGTAMLIQRLLMGFFWTNLFEIGRNVRTGVWEMLDETDVLTWWGHAAHERVGEEVVLRVQKRVWQGMGLVALHSAHNSKPFKRLMGTSCMLRWREAAEKERVWIVDPSHPIVAGFTDECFELPHTEMYGEFFDIPQPDELFTISWFEGGEVFRSGCVWRRGKGRVVYFSPGHETFPIYHDPPIIQILANAARWAAAPHGDGSRLEVVKRAAPLEPLPRPAGRPAR